MEGNNRYYSSQTRANQKNEPNKFREEEYRQADQSWNRSGDYRNREEYVNPPEDRKSQKWTSNYPTSDANSRDYSTQGQDRWPGDPERMNQAHNNQSSEIWSRGSDYITPSKWQERSREPRAGYFNNYQNDHSEMNARGEHAGRGPKGYQRSDERIREEVCEALMQDQWVNASDIEVEVKSGVVTLRGSVEDRRMKRQAEDCVGHSSSVKDVRNELTIGSPKKERTDDSVSRSMN